MHRKCVKSAGRVVHCADRMSSVSAGESCWNVAAFVLYAKGTKMTTQLLLRTPAKSSEASGRSKIAAWWAVAPPLVPTDHQSCVTPCLRGTCVVTTTQAVVTERWAVHAAHALSVSKGSVLGCPETHHSALLAAAITSQAIVEA